MSDLQHTLGLIAMAARREQARQPTIDCPICGTDTGVRYQSVGAPLPEGLVALRDKMRTAGLSKKAVMFWTLWRRG